MFNDNWQYQFHCVYTMFEIVSCSCMSTQMQSLSITSFAYTISEISISILFVYTSFEIVSCILLMYGKQMISISITLFSHFILRLYFIDICRADVINISYTVCWQYFFEFLLLKLFFRLYHVMIEVQYSI